MRERRKDVEDVGQGGLLGERSALTGRLTAVLIATLDQTPLACEDMHKLMDVKAAADYLGLSVSFLEHARGKGTGPPYYKVGQRVLYSAKDIDAWLKTKRQNP